jgi:hypothetical protein
MYLINSSGQFLFRRLIRFFHETLVAQPCADCHGVARVRAVAANSGWRFAEKTPEDL